jgi:hypothetical protein
MALLTPLWMQSDIGTSAIEYPLSQDRLGLMGSLFSRTGVMDLLAGHFAVGARAAGANQTVDIAAGRGVVADGQGGMYLCTSTAVENRSVARPTSGSRTYLIYLQVRDKKSFGDSASDFILSTISNNNTTVPATPSRSIPLAYVTLTSSTTTVTTGATSSTNAQIVDLRTRATVGTMGLTGSWGTAGIADVWQNWDSTRPLRWMKNSDGWVFLAGWVRRQISSGSVAAREFWHLDRSAGYGAAATPVLPAEIRPNGARDVHVMTQGGLAHVAIQPSGTMPYQFFSAQTFGIATNGEFWMSFDGVFYKQFNG